MIYPKRTSDTWNTKDFFNIPYNLDEFIEKL